MTHSFEPIPFDVDGKELACLLDGPAHLFRIGCSCGWVGPEIPLPVDRHYTLPDAVYEEVEAAWETLHYVDAALADREGKDDLIIALPDAGATGPLDMSEFERMLALS